MAPFDDINVEVTISQELRDLLKRPVIAPEEHGDLSSVRSSEIPSFASTRNDPEQPQEPAPHQTAPVSQQSSRMWPSQRIVLRRDGERPLVLDGQILFNVEGHWPEGQASFAHRCSVYLGRDGSLTLALAFLPNTEIAMRPHFWAKPVAGYADFERLVALWCDEVLLAAEIALRADDATNQRVAPCEVRSVFRSMTAQCLRVAVPQKERKEQCLQ